MSDLGEYYLENFDFEVPPEAFEYPQPVETFDEYELAYQEYLAHTTPPPAYAPAVSAKDLFLRPKLTITSYAEGFIYAGSLNLIAGEPKAGKSTLAWHVINAISSGQPFLGRQTRKANVVYVTEQNEVSFRQETQNIPGFADNPNIFILLPEDASGNNWSERVGEWGSLVKATNAGVLVIDTFGAFASLPPNGENDSASISERIMQLKHLYKTKTNLAIVLIHHIRKPSVDPRSKTKEFAELRDARGSSAIVGGVDHCVMLSKSEDDPRVRNIHLEGRFGEEESFYIKLTDKGYKEKNSFRSL